MPLKNGTLLSGNKYRIVRYLSGGGFGCTYEAIHTGLNGRVAIKEFFLKAYCNRDAETGYVTVGTNSETEFVEKLKSRFIREARLQFNLRHPGIVHVSDVFEENGTAYYVMDYIDGENLAQISDRRGRMSEQEALGYIRDICDALEYVHSERHLHLDIKPQNIMVDSKGRAILIDFGTSKQYENEVGALTTTTFGLTPGYAPAELHDCDKDSYTPATDIYSIGATLYKLLTGEVPATSTKRSSGAALAPLPPEVSASTRAAVAKAMNLRRDQRPQSVTDFLALLDSSSEQTVNLIDEPIVKIIDEPIGINSPEINGNTPAGISKGEDSVIISIEEEDENAVPPILKPTPKVVTPPPSPQKPPKPVTPPSPSPKNPPKPVTPPPSKASHKAVTPPPSPKEAPKPVTPPPSKASPKAVTPPPSPKEAPTPVTPPPSLKKKPTPVPPAPIRVEDPKPISVEEPETNTSLQVEVPKAVNNTSLPIEEPKTVAPSENIEFEDEDENAKKKEKGKN